VQVEFFILFYMFAGIVGWWMMWWVVRIPVLKSFFFSVLFKFLISRLLLYCIVVHCDIYKTASTTS
jgi:hypothetical protein